jgi:peptide/nickel transport system permease protein
LRELEYIQSARAFGVSTPRVLWRHIVPNLMHLVLINTVMQFSSFVLAEAVLSYVGVGVDPKTASFGVMINTARAELAATPLVWWSLTTAFGFMFLIVLPSEMPSILEPDFAMQVRQQPQHKRLQHDPATERQESGG